MFEIGLQLKQVALWWKVQNQPVGRCQGFTEKGQTMITRKESRKLHRRSRLSSLLDGIWRRASRSEKKKHKKPNLAFI